MWPCFAGLLDPERLIAVIIATGKHADCDIITTVQVPLYFFTATHPNVLCQVTGFGMKQLGACTYPRGTFPVDGHGLEVIALPQADTFVVLNERTKDPRQGCVKYNYAFEGDPRDKEAGPIPLTEVCCSATRITCMTDPNSGRI